MANTKKNEEKEEKKVPEGKGWEDVNPLESRFYTLKEPGAIWAGLLIGRYERNDRKGYYYQVRVGAETPAKTSDGEVVMLPAGEVINVDETKALERLAHYAAMDEDFEIWIHCVEKIKVTSGSFWKMDVKVRKVN